jgi:signal transduction histidine kinase
MNGSALSTNLLMASDVTDIASNNQRLILTRWIAGLMVLLATGVSTRLLGLALPENALYLIGVFILAYNAALAWFVNQQLSPGDALRTSHTIRQLVVIQIGLDWICMAAFLHFTGGVTSPAIVFFFIHTVMVNILIPGQSPYIYAAVAIGGLLTLALLEAGSILPHYSILPGMPDDIHTNRFYIFAVLGFFGVGLLATVFITASIMARLRERERQIGALLQTAQDVNSTLELKDTLRHLASNAAQALSVRAASIRLLDEDSEHLSMAAAHGLSKDYINKGPVKVSNSMLDQEALRGNTVIICDPLHDERLQYPQEMAEEGIESILVVPIISATHRRPLGVLRAYSEEEEFFNEDDTYFVQAIAQQGAIAIENAMAHAALQNADQEREEFVRTVTHELRAPVTGSQSLLGLLSRGLVGDLTEQQQDIVMRLERRMESLLALVSDLLAFAASQAIDMHQTLEPMPLCETLQHVVDRASAQAAEKSIDLQYDCHPTALYIQSTEEGLSRIFDNLIGNAVKYTPENGKVYIQVLENGPDVVVTVADTGIGIPADEVERLGEEFFRATNAKQSGIVGSGLGLVIVKQLIEHFGGRMRVDSSIGKGTTFTVTLPLELTPPE